MVPAQPLKSAPETVRLEETRAAIPELAGMLRTQMDDLVAREQSTRSLLDEQVMDSPGDDADASVIDNSADYFMRISNNHHQELVEIRAALDRIEQGSYGICQNCDDTIPVARLRFQPTAHFCVDCQSRTEHTTPRLPARDRPTL